MLLIDIIESPNIFEIALSQLISKLGVCCSYIYSVYYTLCRTMPIEEDKSPWKLEDGVFNGILILTNLSNS